MMGVHWEDSYAVAELLGIKTFLNEFVGYTELAKIICNRRLQLVGQRMITVSDNFFL